MKDCKRRLAARIFPRLQVSSVDMGFLSRYHNDLLAFLSLAAFRVSSPTRRSVKVGFIRQDH